VEAVVKRGVCVSSVSIILVVCSYQYSLFACLCEKASLVCCTFAFLPPAGCSAQGGEAFCFAQQTACLFLNTFHKDVINVCLKPLY
jgi:hypothetical protein